MDSVSLPGPERPELLCVVNGYALTWDLYQKNPRIRGVDIVGDNQASVSTTLTDPGTSEHFAVFQDVRLDLDAIRTVKITITSVYGGTGRKHYTDASLSEIEFWGPR